MKRLMVIVLSLVVAMSMSVTAFADSITEEDAYNAVVLDSGVDPANVVLIESEFDDTSYEIEFIDSATGTDYSYEVMAASGNIVEKSVEFKVKKNTSKKKIGKKKARKIAANHSGISYKVVKKGKCKFEREHKQGKYEVKFRANGYKYDYEILAPNGKIKEYEWEMINKR
ncbi:MAG: hypothetical protein Q4A65_07410 [Bacillota bacterium]|nr:hypothetical protein [Bacillota bacterium]